MTASVARRVAISLAVLTAVGVLAFMLLAWRSAIPVASATQSFTTRSIARGEILSAAGNCASCHTTSKDKPFAGGFAVKTDFGTIYSRNITPDRDMGIGAWSEPAFRRAMREGVSRDGSHLFPAFPYDHFKNLTDTDVSDLYAYFMTRVPIAASSLPNSLPFPLNVRALQAGWKFLFFKSEPLKERADRSADWNRGAYLAEGIAHCGACHTPHNRLGAEKREDAYAGSTLDRRTVPALTAANISPVPWSEPELYAYLRTGTSSFHGQAGGPMASVIRDGLSKLPDTDINALSVYFAEISGAAARANEAKVAIERAQSADHRDLALKTDDGAKLYVSACASCHYNSGDLSHPQRPSIALMSAINARDPTDLVETILRGRRASMPAFANGLRE